MAKVLVVDDRAVDRELLVTLLGYAGHRALQAADGAEALQMACSEQPDLVITDVLMPAMDGYELVRRLRAEPSLARTSVIFYTGTYLEGEARALAQACGVKHLLVKPVEPQVLLDTIAEALAARAPAPEGLWVDFDRQHLRLVTDKLARNAEAVEAANRQLGALVDLGLKLASDVDPRVLLDRCSQAVRDLLDARYVAIALFDDDHALSRLSASGFDDDQLQRLRALRADQGVWRALVKERRAIRLDGQAARAQAPGLVPNLPLAHSLLATPVASPSHVYGGLLCLNKTGERVFSDEDESLAGMLAAQLALAYENLQRYELIRQDAADLEQRSQELAAERDRLRVLLDSVPDEVLAIDAEGKVILINPSATHGLGLRPAEHTRRPLVELLSQMEMEILNPDGRPRPPEEAPFLRALKGERIQGEEIARQRGTGELRYRQFTAAPVHDARGQIIGAIAVIRDITARKKAEAERERLLERIRESNQQLIAAALRERETTEEAQRHAAEVERLHAELEAIFVAQSDPVIVYDRQGIIVHANPAALAICGLDPVGEDRAVLAQKLAMRHPGRPLAEEDLPSTRALRGERVVSEYFLVTNAQGREIAIQASATPLLLANQIQGAVSVWHDITDLHELQQQREEYIRLISHDLRNPLTPLMGMASWLQRRMAEQGLPQEAKSAETIVTSARRMNAMIQELVDSARLEAGRVELRTQALDLCQFATEVGQRVGTQQDQARLRVECETTMAPARADPERLERVLANLLTNAFKYSAPDRPVVARAEQRNGEVVVSVADQGVGIPPEELPRVFERYYRARTGQRQAEGLGLGLYIARLIVEAHGGRIWAESQVGKGSTFFFSLPLSSG